MIDLRSWWGQLFASKTPKAALPEPRGYALCIGVNRVDPTHYDGWDGKLQGCENDAIGMSKALKRRGFIPPKILLTREATSGAVLAHLADLARAAQPGDIVVVTNSSHGGQVPDYDGDEFDDRDETICMYDRQLLDDELELAWSQFRRDVRILFVSDSCHSGTMCRARIPVSVGVSTMLSRAAPPTVLARVAAGNVDLYRGLQSAAREREPIKASLLSLSACADNQTAMDGVGNGLFTGSLLTILEQYSTENLGRVIKRVGRDIGALQSPQYRYGGPRCAAFEQSPAFSIRTPEVTT